MKLSASDSPTSGAVVICRASYSRDSLQNAPVILNTKKMRVRNVLGENDKQMRWALVWDSQPRVNSVSIIEKMIRAENKFNYWEHVFDSIRTFSFSTHKLTLFMRKTEISGDYPGNFGNLPILMSAFCKRASERYLCLRRKTKFAKPRCSGIQTIGRKTHLLGLHGVWRTCSLRGKM